MGDGADEAQREAEMTEGEDLSTPPDGAEPVIEGTAEVVNGGGDPDDAKPEGEQLVPIDEADVHRAMTLLDERQIMDEIQGRALEAMLYSFPQDGKTVTGFSWAGVAEAARTLNARGYTSLAITKDPPPIFEEVTVSVEVKRGDPYEDRPAIACTVYAEDTKNGGGNWGTAVQPREMRLRKTDNDGRFIFRPDSFARAKALSKAQRNAIEPQLPQELVEAVKAQYLRAGRVKRITGADTAEVGGAELPPALTDEEATKQIERIRDVYDEIKTLNRVLVVPAQFNRMLTMAQHDHGRLNDLIRHLEDLRDREKEIDAMAGELTEALGTGDAAKVLKTIDQRPSQKERHAAITAELAKARESS